MNKIIIAVLIIIILVVGGWFFINKINAPSQSATSTSTDVVYSNTNYGFSINLPTEWAGFTVDHQTWNGQIYDKNGAVQRTDTGAVISISAPASAGDKQPIPVMAFTHAQWSLVMAGNNSTTSQYMSVSAAPITPSELGENSKYVFAIPARYNYAYPAGFEKTDAIINDKSAWSFFEPAGITFTSPKSGDVWRVGETHRVNWLGGGDRVTLFLINKNLAQTAGQSVSITDRFYNVPNVGYYDYTVKQEPTGLYSWSVTDLIQSATSSAFTIK